MSAAVAFSPGVQAQVDLLRRHLLRGAQGFGLHLVVIDGDQRDELLRRLRAWSGKHGVPRLHELPRGEAGGAELLRWLSATSPRVMPGVILPDGDALLGSGQLCELNMSRDRLGELVGGPLVVLVSPEGEAALAGRAPDLVAVRRSVVVLVDVEDATEPPPDSPEPESPGERLWAEATRLDRLAQGAEPPPAQALADAWLRLARRMEALGDQRGLEHAAQRVAVEARRIGYTDALEQAEAMISRGRLRPRAGLCHFSATPAPLPSWDLFLAHAAKDADTADALYQRLSGPLRVFLDKRCLPLGADWDTAIQQAQARSAVTVVLVSRHSTEAFYERAEVAAAIAAARQDPEGHRVVPVYLDRQSTGMADQPYGLGLKQGLRLDQVGGLDGVAERLIALGTKLGLGRPERQPVTVAVVAVRQELDEAQRAVCAALERRREVGRAISVAAELGELPAADLVVVLVGGRTGGTEVLSRALGGGAWAYKASKVDMDHVPEDEFSAARAVRREVESAFSDTGDLVTQVRAAIDAWLRQRAQDLGASSSVLEDWEAAYLRARQPCWGRGTDGPLATHFSHHALVRQAVYVSLTAETDLAWEDENGALHISPRQAVEPTSESRPDNRRPTTLERALCAPELATAVVLGEPGSGKTVLLQHVACVLAAAHTDAELPPHALELDRFERGRPLLPVPVLVLARRLAETEVEGIAALVEAMRAEVKDAIGQPPEAEAMRAGLEAGRYALLIDSLDEVPDQEGRLRVVRTVEAFASLGWPSRVVLSTRPATHTHVQLGPLPVLRIAELDARRQAAIVDRWCAFKDKGEPFRRGLLAAMGEATRRLGRANFARNPLLLTAAILVYVDQQALPDSTAALYESLVSVLCRSRRAVPLAEGAATELSPDLKRQALERVALELQEAGGTELSVARAAASLVSWRPEDLTAMADGLGLLDRLANDTGLLRFEDRTTPQDRPLRVVRPWHRSFQEYLAACRLASGTGSVADETDELVVGERAVAFDPAWEGVLRFLVGVQGAIRVERAHDFLGRLFALVGEAPPERAGRLLGLAAAGLVEYPELFQGHALVEQVRGEIVTRYAADGASWPVLDRLLALEGLGRLGDPRLAGDPWVWLDDGVAMAWRPVTVQDFKPFVDNGGYGEDRWWLDDSEGVRAWTEPGWWDEQVFHPNRPVMGVSWFEAMAWCRWVNETPEARAAWCLQDGWSVGLPTGEEWDRAAGRDKYPWGDEEPRAGGVERANFGELREQVGHPTPVGAFPAGCPKDPARERLVDLGGNVWEWTLERFDAQPGDPPGGGDRVVRGGSWYYPARDLRSAVRVGLGPGNRIRLQGIRVVCRRSPSR